MRRGFGLMQAIAIVLLVGGALTLALRYARVGAVHTVDAYTRERAELFLRSATETALLQISGHDRSAGCLDKVEVISKEGDFVATIRIVRYYLLEGSEDLALCGGPGIAVETEESHGMVLMEAEVRTVPGAGVRHPVRLLRRSLQRP